MLSAELMPMMLERYTCSSSSDLKEAEEIHQAYDTWTSKHVQALVPCTFCKSRGDTGGVVPTANSGKEQGALLLGPDEIDSYFLSVD